MNEDEQNVEGPECGQDEPTDLTSTDGDSAAEDAPGGAEDVSPSPPSLPPHVVENGSPSPQEGTNSSEEFRQLLAVAERQQETLSELSKLFERRLLYDQSKERAFDSLYQELAELKSDKHVEAVRPILRDLLLVFDRIDRASSEQENDRVAELLVSFRDELLETLYRAGADLIPASKTFDPQHQMAVGRKDTTDPDLSGRIAEVVRRGFRLHKVLLRPEEVVVYNVVALPEDTEERGSNTPDGCSGPNGVDEKGVDSGNTT